MNLIIKESLPRGMTFKKPLILEVHHFTPSVGFSIKREREKLSSILNPIPHKLQNCGSFRFNNIFPRFYDR
jgi:hypothetical protein